MAMGRLRQQWLPSKLKGTLIWRTAEYACTFECCSEGAAAQGRFPASGATLENTIYEVLRWNEATASSLSFPACWVAPPAAGGKGEASIDICFACGSPSPIHQHPPQCGRKWEMGVHSTALTAGVACLDRGRRARAFDVIWGSRFRSANVLGGGRRKKQAVQCVS